MGSRLSMPRGPAGTTEISNPKTSPWPRRRLSPLHSRQLLAPMAAFTMACILFVYARTSIKVAKSNAQRHRDRDSGGEGLNLLNESRRRHGRMEKLDEGGTISELARGAREQLLGKRKDANEGVKEGKVLKSEEEDKLRAAMGRRGGGGGGGGGSALGPSS